MLRLAMILIFGLCAPVTAADIPQGAHVLLRMLNSISTRTAQPGDAVYMQTASPIAAGGRILVPVGSYVNGSVVDSKRSGRTSGRAQIALRIETLTLPSGTVVRVAPHLTSVDPDNSDQKMMPRENDMRQGGTKGRDAALIAVIAGSGASAGGLVNGWEGAGIGAAAGAAVGVASVLVTRGREVDLRAGATFDVVFERPVSIE
jgi:hypothetical protein